MWSKVYDILTDDIWQSVGVIIGAIGIFLGAYFGSKLGYRYALEKDKKDQEDSLFFYLHALYQEQKINLECLHKIKTCIVINPPILTALKPIEIGAKHLKSEVWSSIISNGLITLMHRSDSLELGLAHKNILRTAHTLEISCTNWVRIYDFHDWDTKNASLQPANLSVVMQTIINELLETVNNSIETTTKSIKLLESRFEELRSII